jgi:hypothetical protein
VADRTPTARAFADELAPLLSGSTEIDDAMLVAYRPPVRRDQIQHSETLSSSLPPPTRSSPRPAAPVIASPPRVRRGLVLGGLAVALVAAGAGLASWRRQPDEPAAPRPDRAPRPDQAAKPAAPPALPAVTSPSGPVVDPATLDVELPDKLVHTPGASWWQRDRARCTPGTYRAGLAAAPTDSSGTAFAIACAACAGDLAQAHELLSRLDSRDRAVGVSPLVHFARGLFKRANDDRAAMTFAELALEAQPENQHLLWITGVTELQDDKPAEARHHLRLYVDSHGKDDDWSRRARAMLEALDAHDCKRELRDGLERLVRLSGCPVAR